MPRGICASKYVYTWMVTQDRLTIIGLFHLKLERAQNDGRFKDVIMRGKTYERDKKNKYIYI